MIANRSPPAPVFIGSTRLSMAAVATAASMALPPFIMICRPACAASGWLVVTMPCVAMISARLCAAQPSARSPRTAAQAAARGSLLQTDIGGPDWAHAGEEAASTTAAPIAAHARVVAYPMASSRAAAFLELCSKLLLEQLRAGGQQIQDSIWRLGASALAPQRDQAGQAPSTRRRARARAR